MVVRFVIFWSGKKLLVFWLGFGFHLSSWMTSQWGDGFRIFCHGILGNFKKTGSFVQTSGFYIVKTSEICYFIPI